MSYTGRKAGVRVGNTICKRCGQEAPETVYHSSEDVTLLHHECPNCCDSGVRGIPPGDCIFVYEEEEVPREPETYCTGCGLPYYKDETDWRPWCQCEGLMVGGRVRRADIPLTNVPVGCVFTTKEEIAPFPRGTPRCTQCGLEFRWILTADSQDKLEIFPRCPMDCPRPLTGTIPPARHRYADTGRSHMRPDFTRPPVIEMRAKYPGVKFFDPPRGGLNLKCAACTAKAWLPAHRFKQPHSFPHGQLCPHSNKGLEGVIVVDVTGTPCATTWHEHEISENKQSV